MSLPKMTTPVNNISLLDDLPNAVGGLSAAELKARFDKAGGDIQTFLNETLIPAIEQMGVDEGAARDAAIQAAIDALDLDTTFENLQKAIVAAESSAKEYANTKDAANLAAAKQYADTKAAAAQSAAESTAATDAASKADAALLSAKSYANQQDAVTLLNADAAAKNYANQQDAATLQSAKEYTDGKIPSKLPNPQKLKFTGAVTGEYDGSEEKTINIPTGGGDVPAVLGNLAAQIGDAAAGTIPVYAGDEAWTIEKLITEYNEATPLSGYIPDTAWVAAYLSKNTVQRVDGWGGENGIASLARNMPIGICNGTKGTPPIGMIFPALLIFGAQSYGNVAYTCLDANGAVWYGSISLSNYTVTAHKRGTPVPASAAEDAGKLLQVGADGAAAWGSKLPTALKNPNALTFTGAATGTYDGSAALTVNIPSGGPSINWRGEWAETTKYSKLDAVSYEGSSYIYASDTPPTGAIPGIDGEWQLLAQKGASGTDLSLGVTGATVGQIAKITAVDTNGKPTAWAPVDMPSGGGSNWVKLYDGSSTIAEEVSSFEVNLSKSDPMKEFQLWLRLDKNTAADWGESKNISVAVNGANIGYFGFLNRLNTHAELFVERSFEAITVSKRLLTSLDLGFNWVAPSWIVRQRSRQTNDGKLSISFSAPYAGKITATVFGRY